MLLCLVNVVPVYFVVIVVIPVICDVAVFHVVVVVVVDGHSALLGHVPWLSTSVAHICGLLSFCSFASFAVVVVSFTFVVSFSFSFVVVSSFERISLRYRLIVSVVSFSSFVIVVVAVAATALSFVVLSFVLSFVSIGGGPWLSLLVAACSLTNCDAALWYSTTNDLICA